jgi:hypothetical protein
MPSRSDTTKPLLPIWISSWRSQSKNIFMNARQTSLRPWWNSSMSHNNMFFPKWCTSITVMTEKDPGNPWIECSWVIHLFEADYNLCLKLIWGSQMVHQGEDNDCFGKQQHGSWPQHQAINAVHMNTLMYNLTRILLLSLVMIDNDATGCFDWIIILLAMIATFQLGMPRLVARMHSSALLLMKYL